METVREGGRFAAFSDKWASTGPFPSPWQTAGVAPESGTQFQCFRVFSSWFMLYCLVCPNDPVSVPPCFSVVTDGIFMKSCPRSHENPGLWSSSWCLGNTGGPGNPCELQGHGQTGCLGLSDSCFSPPRVEAGLTCPSSKSPPYHLLPARSLLLLVLILALCLDSIGLRFHISA